MKYLANLTRTLYKANQSRMDMPFFHSEFFPDKRQLLHTQKEIRTIYRTFSRDWASSSQINKSNQYLFPPRDSLLRQVK